MKRIAISLLAVLLAFSMFACGDSTEADAAPAPQKAISFGAKKTGSGGEQEGGKTSGAAGDKSAAASSGSKKGTYKIPAFRESVFNPDEAEGNDAAQVDMSHKAEGYVSMRCESDKKVKFQVIKGDITYTYSVVTGEDQVFPLQSGDGHYQFRVMENISDNKYAELYKCETDVTIANPFDPFLRPNQYADFSEESECVKLAASFAKSSDNAEELIGQIYEYVCSNVTYDKELAKNVKSGYLPDPDRTLKEKKGICLDYACLAASMLRSMGIPTKVIFGYVAPNDLYHAWNKFYTEESGWTLVEFKVTGNEWNRIDLTFAANGTDAEYIGDGSNYMEAYVY